MFLFFQAEDGIRDVAVTGVQTCALPISAGLPCSARSPPSARPFLKRFVEQTHSGRTGDRWLNKSPRPPAPRYSAESLDRKSTRLNSSHGYISYAVFCLKKKNYSYAPSIHSCSTQTLS